MKKHATVIVGVLAATVVAAALVSTSLLFAGSDGTEAVVRDASVQLRAEGTLSAATVARSLVREAVVIGLSDRGGEEVALQTVIDQAGSALTETESRAAALRDLLGDERADLEAATSDFVAASRSLLDSLPGNRPADAADVEATEVSAAFDRLTQILVSERDARERHIAAVRAGVGGVAQAARFLVAFVIPAVSIVGVLALNRHRQRRILREAEALREVELRRARDEFLSAVAHELRTPLTAVVGFAELLRDRDRSLTAREREEMIEVLADQAVDSAAMVGNLLIFARANVGQLGLDAEIVDVRTAVEKMTREWGHADLQRLRVVGDAEVWADRVRVEQVVRNLLSNALRHGGHRIEVRIISDEPAVQVTVADDGPGIPEELRARIFDPYQHGESPGQPASMGLGLTVARSLAQRMDGDLTYDARPGESVFTLTLPAARRVTAHPKPSSPNEAPAPVSRLEVSQVREILEAGKVDIVFQRIVDVGHGEEAPVVVGVEALARFPVGSPQEWFRVAARAGMGEELELVAIRSAIDAFSPSEDDLFLSVNLSFETLMSPRLVEALDGIDPYRVVLELTEEAIINHYQEAGDHLSMLTSRGYRLAVDNMGTAHTELWHLVRLRPAFVKLDIRLIRDLDLDADTQAVMRGLHWLAQSLSLGLIAEGIEREEELDTLRRLGVSWAQGHLFGRPGELTDPRLQPSYLTRPSATGA